MALSSFVGSFNVDTAKTAGQTQAITGVGFQPKIVFIWFSGSTATGDTVAGGLYNIGFGAATSSTNQMFVNSVSNDALASSDCQNICTDESFFRGYSTIGSANGIFDLVSMDADGFTLTIVDQFSRAYRLSYLALGGTDLTNVYVGIKQTPASTGTYDITDVGFRPDAIILGSCFVNSELASAGGFVSIGMATSSSAQGTVSIGVQDGQATTNTSRYAYSNEVLAWVRGEGVNFRNQFSAFLDNGFTLDNLEGASQFYFVYAALKGGQYSVGNLLTRTDGNDIAETVGFQPVALLFASTNSAENSQDSGTTNSRLSIGAATSTSNRACAAISDEDNLADTETAYANYDSAVYAHVKDDAIEALMDLKSIESDGFTCVMDDTETAGCWVTYLAIGEAVVEYTPRHGFILYQEPGIV